jgi:hypothetical protein
MKLPRFPHIGISFIKPLAFHSEKMQKLLFLHKEITLAHGQNSLYIHMRLSKNGAAPNSWMV